MPSGRVSVGGIWAAVFLGATLAFAEAPPASTSAELDAVRQEAVAAAQAEQQQERKVTAFAGRLDLLRRTAEGGQRDLDESRPEQEALLSALVHLARNPPDKVLLGAMSPLDEARGRMLIAAMLPELRAQAHALAEEVERVAALRSQIADQEPELQRQREALRGSREALAASLVRRGALNRKLAPVDVDAEKRLARLWRDAADLAELIRRADAEADRRDKDSGEPAKLRAFDTAHASPVMPAVGAVESAGNSGEGMSLAAAAGAVVVAPFDAQVVYAGAFREYGPTLILRHGGGYHSVLAGLGRLEVGNGQAVLAGEPLGMMPEAAGDGAAGKLYIELRRDGRPVRPQPWLASPGEQTGRSAETGEQRVRE
ncbi:MAG TPA: peptidoglycan DD-metalloendopeptidase family protein [Stellaceae bacterium]